MKPFTHSRQFHPCLAAVVLVACACGSATAGVDVFSIVNQPLHLGANSDPLRIPLGQLPDVSNHRHGSYRSIVASRPSGPDEQVDDPEGNSEQNLAALFGITLSLEDPRNYGALDPHDGPVVIHVKDQSKPKCSPYTKDQAVASIIHCLVVDWRMIDWFNDGIDPKTGEPTMTVEFLLCQPRTAAETAVLADFRRLTEAGPEPLRDAAALAKHEAPLAFDFARLRLFHPCKEANALELSRIFAEQEFDVDPPDSALGPFFIPGIHQGDDECGILRGRVGDAGSEKVLWRFAFFGEDVFKSLPDWIVWTPEGYFACSPKALGRIAWRVSHGTDSLATIEPVEHFKQQYLRPDIIRQMMATGKSAAEIVANPGAEPEPPNQ